MSGKVDILLISETKINGIFPTSQFRMSGFSNVYLLGIMLSVKGNLIAFPVRGFCFSGKTEILRVELNLGKQKWLIFCGYNTHKHLIKKYLLQIKYAIDFYSKSHENIILILGDFNAETSDSHMDSFCAICHLKSLVGEPTCY